MMYTFFLLHGEQAIVDDDDQIFIEGCQWHINTKGDIVGGIAGETVLLRRLIASNAGMLHDPRDVVMHFDGNKLNCCRDNLRIITRKEMMKATGAIKFDSLASSPEECAIYLHTGEKVFVDRQDFPLIEHYRWREDTKRFIVRSEEVSGKHFYTNGHSSGNVLLHHLVAQQINGSLHPHQRVHHRDGDKLNNRRHNLHIVDPGIRKKGDKYHVSISVYGQTFYGGSYVLWEEAASAYNQAASYFFKEHAYHYTVSSFSAAEQKITLFITRFIKKIQEQNL